MSAFNLASNNESSTVGRLNIFTRYPYQKWIHISNILLLLAVAVFYTFAKHIVTDTRFILIPLSLREDPTLVFGYLVLVIQAGILQAIGIYCTSLGPSCPHAQQNNSNYYTTDEGAIKAQGGRLISRKRRRSIAKALRVYCYIVGILLVCDVVLGMIWVFRFNTLANGPSTGKKFGGIKNYRYFETAASKISLTPIKGFFYTTTASFLFVPWVKAIEANFLNRYGVDQEYTRAWDAFQVTQECCGYHKPGDFLKTYWFQHAIAIGTQNSEILSSEPDDNSKLSAPSLRDVRRSQPFQGLNVVPYSCCRASSLNNINFASINQLPYTGIKKSGTACNPYDYNHPSVSQQGCSRPLRKWIAGSANNLYFIGYCFLTLIKAFALIIIWREARDWTHSSKKSGIVEGYYAGRMGGDDGYLSNNPGDDEGIDNDFDDITPPLIDRSLVEDCHESDRALPNMAKSKDVNHNNYANQYVVDHGREPIPNGENMKKPWWNALRLRYLQFKDGDGILKGTPNRRLVKENETSFISISGKVAMSSKHKPKNSNRNYNQNFCQQNQPRFQQKMFVPATENTLIEDQHHFYKSLKPVPLNYQESSHEGPSTSYNQCNVTSTLPQNPKNTIHFGTGEDLTRSPSYLRADTPDYQLSELGDNFDTTLSHFNDRRKKSTVKQKSYRPEEVRKNIGYSPQPRLNSTLPLGSSALTLAQHLASGGSLSIPDSGIEADMMQQLSGGSKAASPSQALKSPQGPNPYHHQPIYGFMHNPNQSIQYMPLPLSPAQQPFAMQQTPPFLGAVSPPTYIIYQQHPHFAQPDSISNHRPQFVVGQSQFNDPQIIPNGRKGVDMNMSMPPNIHSYPQFYAAGPLIAPVPQLTPLQHQPIYDLTQASAVVDPIT